MTNKIKDPGDNIIEFPIKNKRPEITSLFNKSKSAPAQPSKALLASFKR